MYGQQTKQEHEMWMNQSKAEDETSGNNIQGGDVLEPICQNCPNFLREKFREKENGYRILEIINIEVIILYFKFKYIQ